MFLFNQQEKAKEKALHVSCVCTSQCHAYVPVSVLTVAVTPNSLQRFNIPPPSLQKRSTYTPLAVVWKRHKYTCDKLCCFISKNFSHVHNPHTCSFPARIRKIREFISRCKLQLDKLMVIE